MGVLSQYRTDRLVQRLLAQDNLNSPAANDLVGRLRRDADNAVDDLLGRLAHAPRDDYRAIALALYKLLDDATLESFYPGLRNSSARVVQVLAKVLTTSKRYNPNRLVKLFEDPATPKSHLIGILSAHSDRLDPELLLRYAARLEIADQNALFKVIEQIADESLVPGLLNRATAADASVRAHVIRLLGHFPGTETAAALEAALTDQNRSVRLAALEGLARADARPDLATMMQLLRDPDVGIQSRAIDAVIRLADPDTMDHLLPILRDESEYVRRAGVEVLNEIADASLISDLLFVLRDDDWWVRERAADALARIGGPRVVDAMLVLIRNEDEFVRRTAIEVINTSRDPRAYDHLIAALEDEDWWVKERAVDALTALGAASAVPNLLRLLRGDAHARPTVLRALATLGDATVVPAVLDCLEGDDAQARLEALRALDALADEDWAVQVVDRIEGAMEAGDAAFRDQARAIVAGIRQRYLSADSESGPRDAAGAEGHTMIARPGQPPQPLESGTRLDIAGLTPGTVIDRRYRFIERVGHGAFGTVTRFEDTTVGEEIILKFLNQSVAERESVAQRFLKELRYARRVTHPNVIRIYDFLRIGGLYAISMEFFEGFPLTRELLQDQPMRTDRALRLLREIAFGMTAAHNSGVIHRDLKPANILMNHRDQVKVVDFGIAAAAFQDSEETELTRTGDFVGTPAYTSPEQVCHKTVDARTDVYSLGVVMYRMLGGRLPYRDKNWRNLLGLHLEGRPPPLRDLNPELPDGLPEVVQRAMAVKPEERYGSMTEMRQDLERFLQQ